MRARELLYPGLWAVRQLRFGTKLTLLFILAAVPLVSIVSMTLLRNKDDLHLTSVELEGIGWIEQATAVTRAVQSHRGLTNMVLLGDDSLVGAGGGFLSVPFMTWCNVPMHQAVATSAALGFPIALSNTLGYLVGGWALPAALPGAVGYLYLPALGVVVLASMSMAPLGARAAHAMDVAQLRRVFALVLYGLAGYMLWKSFHT